MGWFRFSLAREQAVEISLIVLRVAMNAVIRSRLGLAVVRFQVIKMIS